MPRLLKLATLLSALLCVALAYGTPATAAARPLSFGLTGSDVTALQQKLITLGYLPQGSAVGHFGSLTRAAVQKFQCAQGIVCSGSSFGIVGPLTEAALGLGTAAAPVTSLAPAARSLSFGLTGSDVTALQQKLITLGYLPQGSAVGHFGSLTRAAVQKFQCAQGIVCSGSSFGIVGPLTEAALGLGAPMELTGWIPYWRANQGVADVIPHLSQFTSVMPFGFTVTPDGTLNDAGNIGLPPWTTLLQAAHADHVKVIPTVMWSDGPAIDTVLRNAVTRGQHEDQIIAAIEDNGFDGVDIDYEGKLAQTAPYFSAFLKELKAKLGVNRLLYCTIEARTPLSSLYTGTPPPGAGEYANDYTAINQYCDRVQLMTYDQETVDVQLNAAASSTPYIPVADPQWVKKVVELTELTISKQKLMIGVATYGYEWQVTPLAQSGFRYDLQWAFDPDYATQIEQQYGVIPVRNMAGELSIAYLPLTSSSTPPTDFTATTTTNNPNAVATTTYSGGSTMPSIAPSFNLLWWSDAVAISHEVALARELGIRGVAIFKLDGGEDPNMWNVLPQGTHD